VKSVLSIKKTVLSVFMILMLAMAMVGCGSSSSKSDADVAKDKAKEVLALAQEVKSDLNNEAVGYDAILVKIEKALTKQDEFSKFLDDKNLSDAELAEIDTIIVETDAVIADLEAASIEILAVRTAIDALDENSTAAEVAAARAAYDALKNDGYRAKVDTAKLVAAEEALAGAEDEAIEAVEELIEALIDADDVTFENVAEAQTAYLEAKEAYEALSETSKAKVDTAKLDELEAKLLEFGKEVKEVAAIDDITIAAGDELVLPETVEVTLYMDAKVDLKVEWDLKDFDNKVEGETTITGTLVTGDDYSNSLELEATVKVIVAEDEEAPVIELIGNAKVVIKLGATYEDEGATATDNVDGDLTDEIVVAGEVDTDVEGTYKVTYTVADAAGNEGKAERTVIVDGKAPVITLNGEDEVTVVEGSSYEEAGATAEDEVSGEVDVVITGEVDVDKPGKYEVTYTAVDEVGNEATLVRIVNVISDKIDGGIAKVTATGEALDGLPFVKVTLAVELDEENLDKVVKITTNVADAGDTEVYGEIVDGKINATVMIDSIAGEYEVKLKAYTEEGSLVGDTYTIVLKWEDDKLVVVEEVEED
jgi:hypothetical protein